MTDERWTPATREQAAEVLGWPMVVMMEATGCTFEVGSEGGLRVLGDGEPVAVRRERGPMVWTGGGSDE